MNEVHQEDKGWLPVPNSGHGSMLGAGAGAAATADGLGNAHAQGTEIAPRFVFARHGPSTAELKCIEIDEPECDNLIDEQVNALFAAARTLVAKGAAYKRECAIEAAINARDLRGRVSRGARPASGGRPEKIWTR